MNFSTSFCYQDRRTKAEYVWRKYRSVLEGRRILDVGADQQHLKSHLDSQAEYVGVGLGGEPDHVLNLEREPLPTAEWSFDTVLCLDVLEHLDNPHAVFDELCRVSRHYVVISLPNPWANFWAMLHQGQAGLKYYGLPTDPPEDRHKWFFSFSQAEAFVRARAASNGFDVAQVDDQSWGMRTPTRPGGLRGLLWQWLIGQSAMQDMRHGTLWAVLERTTHR